MSDERRTNERMRSEQMISERMLGVRMLSDRWMQGRRNARVMTGAVALGLLLMTGCSTKRYVRNQTQPLAQKTNELDDTTAANNRAIKDVDARSSQGIQQAQGAAGTADQHALAAGQSASQAQQAAQEAVNRADSLAGVISNLDQYKPMADVQVNFAVDKSILTAADKRELDQLGGQLGSARGYLLEVTGGTDSTGSAEYNYGLSQRRASAVVQYLSAKFNVPPHKFYLIGIGKDKEVATNKTAAGRAKNRRVEVQLLSNMTDASEPQVKTTAQVQ